MTRTFTAALILTLFEQRLLALDDPIDRWVPGCHDGRGVTLRHLLGNTSGIVSHDYVGSFDTSRSWTPVELVQWAVDHEPDLRSSQGDVSAPVANLVHAYESTPLVDIADTVDSSFGWAAGGLAATPSDPARWIAAPYGGEVLCDETLAAMLPPTVLDGGEVTEYGLGTFVQTDGTHMIAGHAGGIGGHPTYAYYYVNGGIAVVAANNLLDTSPRHVANAGWTVVLGP